MHPMWCITQHICHAGIALDRVHDEALRVCAYQDMCICHAKISVEQNGAATLACQRQSKIDRKAGLANPALATGYHYRACHITLNPLRFYESSQPET